MQKPFIDFYTQIGFAPTGQQANLGKKHHENRTNLFRKLSLHPKIFKDASVLEIGPGSGENAIDLLNRGIASLRLVDAVPTVLESLKTQIKTDIPVTYELFDASMLSTSHQSFDIVICEGVIPFQLAPVTFFQNISKNVAPGGILLVTTMDGISALSEVIRRLIALSLTLRNGSTVETFEDFFNEDFKTLSGMTRTSKNWILDSILNPWIGSLFSIADALDSCPRDFRPMSMTPNLHTDLAWYKESTDIKAERTAWLESYWRNCHQLIDYRVDSKLVVSKSQNELLLNLCGDVFTEMQHLTAEPNLISASKIPILIKRITRECQQLDNLTKISLEAFVKFIETGDESFLHDFRPFWGRGQQYICFDRS